LWMVTLIKVLNNPGILTETFRQAWNGPPRVSRVDVMEPVVIGSNPRDVFSYTLPQKHASSIIG
jgi:hypothetical protein